MDKVKIIISGYLVVQPRFESRLTCKFYYCCTKPTGVQGDDPRVFTTTGSSFTKTQDTLNAEESPHVNVVLSQAIRIPVDFASYSRAGS
jgi:hypothetical protein